MTVRAILILCLTLAMTLTGGAMHLRATEGPAVAQVVLCINGMTQEVWVDADGTPTNPSHSCPHCILSAAIVATGAVPVAPSKTLSALYRADVALAFSLIRPHEHRARAPPRVLS